VDSVKNREMSDHESTSGDESTSWVEAELADLKSQIVHERSFRKVYGAVGILAFLYGLFYGVYLSK